MVGAMAASNTIGVVMKRLEQNLIHGVKITATLAFLTISILPLWYAVARLESVTGMSSLEAIGNFFSEEKMISAFFLIFLLFNGCQTIENKSQETIKKENEKMSKFLQQPESELKIVMGEPDEIQHDDNGSKFWVYKKKKYSITCERKFEIDRNKMVVGFTSKGCF